MIDDKQWIYNLHSGDQVTWNDPDNGLCTRTFIIGTIEFIGNIVKITDRDGGYIEALVEELS